MPQQLDSASVLTQLTSILEQRRHADAEDSYVASLYQAGLDKILEKVGEEATEVIVAAKNAERDNQVTAACVAEVADLWFHSLVMLSHLDLSATDVLEELQRRFNLSGLEEKASRKTN